MPKKKYRRYSPEYKRLALKRSSDRAIEFMERSVNDDKPFFAYIPYTQVHLPTTPHPDFEDATGNGRWADVLTEVIAAPGNCSMRLTISEFETIRYSSG